LANKKIAEEVEKKATTERRKKGSHKSTAAATNKREQRPDKGKNGKDNWCWWCKLQIISIIGIGSTSETLLVDAMFSVRPRLLKL